MILVRDGKRSSDHSSFHNLMVRRVKMTLSVLSLLPGLKLFFACRFSNLFETVL